MNPFANVPEWSVTKEMAPVSLEQAILERNKPLPPPMAAIKSAAAAALAPLEAGAALSLRDIERLADQVGRIAVSFGPDAKPAPAAATAKAAPEPLRRTFILTPINRR